jgi:hypothetical protein
MSGEHSLSQHRLALTMTHSTACHERSAIEIAVIYMLTGSIFKPGAVHYRKQEGHHEDNC